MTQWHSNHRFKLRFPITTTLSRESEIVTTVYMQSCLYTLPKNYICSNMSDGHPCDICIKCTGMSFIMKTNNVHGQCSWENMECIMLTGEPN